MTHARIQPAGADPGFVEHIEGQALLRRAPSIEGLDGPVLYLAAGASSYVAGHTLVIDGGWTCI